MKPSISIDDVLDLFSSGINLFALRRLDQCDHAYGGWLYDNGLLRRLKRLETQECLSLQGQQGDWVYQLTELGRSRALGKHDPESRWNRKWDGRWRQIVFDLPMERHRERFRLLRWLRQNDFGYLQDSVWIRPDPADEISGFLSSFGANASSVILLECRCVASFSNPSLAQAAWPFDVINKAYHRYQQLAADTTQNLERGRIHARELFAFLKAERKAWRAAYQEDPLLPFSLCPTGYKGKMAWEDRQRLLKLIGTHLLNP